MSKEVVKAIEEYFKKNNDLIWYFGNRKLDAEETIKLLKKDKKFRKEIVEAVVKYSVEILVKGK